jgi:hypothetical protein
MLARRADGHGDADGGPFGGIDPGVVRNRQHKAERGRLLGYRGGSGLFLAFLEQFRAAPGRFMDAPGRFMEVPGRFMEVPGRFMEVPGRFMEVPGRFMEVPGRFLDAPGRFMDASGRRGEAPFLPKNGP